MYKEIYNFDSEDQKTNEEGGLRILKSANESDIKNINQFFNKDVDAKEQKKIEDEMEQLQREIDSLEEVNSGH